MKFPRYSLLLAIVLLFLGRAEGQVAGGNQCVFNVERTVYMVPMKDPADPSRTIKRFAAEFDAERAWEYHASSSDLPARATRRSKVSFTLSDSGSLQFIELEGGQSIRELDFSMADNPMQALTPLLALHPHTQILPELEALRRIGLMISEAQDQGEGELVYLAAEWEWRIQSDSESGRPTRIEQYSRQTGFLARTTDFANWAPQPSGRELPTLVVTRTYYEGQHPAVELVFSNISEERPLPEVPETAIRQGQVPDYGPEGVMGPQPEGSNPRSP